MSDLVRAIAIQPIWDHIKGEVIPAGAEFEAPVEFVYGLLDLKQCEILEDEQ